MAKGYFGEQDQTALREIAKQLLEAGAEVNAKTYEGRTALLMAAYFGELPGKGEVLMNRVGGFFSFRGLVWL